jgi:hypothetical protein
LNQIQSFQTGSLKLLNMSHLWSLGFLERLVSYRNVSNTSLLRLSSQLCQWNVERISRKNLNGLPPDLTLDDVKIVKDMIQVAISKSSVKEPNMIADQLFFLIIGAIQVQSQTNSDQAWVLINKSVQSYLSSQKEKWLFSFGLITTILVFCLGIMTTHSQKMYPNYDDSQVLTEETITGGTDPVSMSMLLLAYNKMKTGTCQLPQAAMLPPEQRQAYLMFINKGVVDVHQVENLRLALGYVNCLYPQALMHPIIPDKHKVAKIAV